MTVVWDTFQMMLPEVCNFGIALFFCLNTKEPIPRPRTRLIFFFYGFSEKFHPRSLRTLRSLAAPLLLPDRLSASLEFSGSQDEK